MRQTTARQWYYVRRQQWHQIERGAFRTYLWEIIGCYEMTLVFLYAPFNRKNLTIFKNEWLAWPAATTSEDFIQMVVGAILVCRAQTSAHYSEQ